MARRTRTPARSRVTVRFAVRACAAIALLFTLAVLLFHPFGPTGDVAVVDVMQAGFAGAGAVGCAVGASRSIGTVRRGWLFLVLACSAWATGEVTWTFYEVALGRESPFPSLADIGFLGFAVVAIPAILLLPSRSGVGDSRRQLLDGLTVVGAISLISWTLVLGPTVRAGGESPALAVALAYPVSDILMLTVALLALAQGSRRRASLVLVSLGLCAMALSDGAFAYLTTTGGFASAGIVDLGWCTAFVLIGLGGSVPSDPSGLETVRAAPRSVVVPTSVLPYIPPAIAAVVVLTQYFRGASLDRVAVILASLLVALVFARQYSVVRDNQTLARTITTHEAELHHHDFHDQLTGLANRALFTDRVTHALELRSRNRHPVSVALIDLDGFKGINDMLGHAGGDEVLVRLAERLQGAVSPADTLARLGGDEFAVLMEDTHEPAAAAHHLVEALRAPFHLEGRSVAVSASIGVASLYPDDEAVGAAVLLSRADIAMYAVKRGGRNGFRLHTVDMRLAEVDDRVLTQSLAEALRARRVRAVFQPILDTATGAVYGYEALARWSHDGAEISPEVFVPVAERVGLVSTLTSLMLDHACAQLASWSAEMGHSTLVVSVNVSAQELGDRSLPDRVLAALQRHGLAADQLMLEITESALVGDRDVAHAVLTSLRSLGVSISLDDFGTGYNGFAQLLGVPLDSVKLDNRFISDIDTNQRSQRLLEGVIALMHHLGLRVVGEGVERPEQLAVLRRLGCDFVQGFLLGRPQDAAHIDVNLGAAQAPVGGAEPVAVAGAAPAPS